MTGKPADDVATAHGYIVEIVEKGTEQVVRRLGPRPLRNAERVAGGVRINLDHEHYYVRLRQADDVAFVEAMERQGYSNVQQKAGRWCGLFRFVFTVGICCDLHADGYERRYCYETKADAERAFEAWDGEGKPTDYIAEK